MRSRDDPRRWSCCRTFAHEMNKRKTNARPLEQQVKNIQLHLLTGLKPAPPLPSFRKLFSGLLLLFGSVVLGSIILLDGRGWHALTTPTQFTILAPLILGACSVTLVVVRSTFAERNDNRNAVACSVVLLVLSIAAVLHTFEPQCEGQFLNVGVRCLGAGLLHALIATAALLAVIRRAARASTSLDEQCDSCAGWVGGCRWKRDPVPEPERTAFANVASLPPGDRCCWWNDCRILY